MEGHSPSAEEPGVPGRPVSEPAAFRPAVWLKGPHLQTLGAALLPCPDPPPLRREVFELSDGDFVEADWTPPQARARALVVILHGLEGSSDSPYARRLALAAHAMGWRAVVLNSRGCGGTPNRLPRGYHAGETADLAEFLDAAKRTYSRTAVVGYSLGGNVLVKYLGEKGHAASLTAAVGVSVPYDLHDASAAINRGFSRVYRNRLLRLMKNRLREGISSGRLDSRWAAALHARDFRSFDDLYTAPAHGFAGVDDYYDRCSAGSFVSGVRAPTLLIHARDDPFMTPACLPARADLPPGVELEAYPSGGHVGFVSGGPPWRPRTWLEGRITAFLAPLLG